MKTILLTIIFIYSINLFNYAQNNNPNTSAVDTVILIAGKKIPAKIINVSSSKVIYKVLETGVTETTERKKLQKIIYSNGKVEIFNKPVYQMVQQGDWKAIVLTENPDDVIGMVKKGDIKANSRKNCKTKKSAKRDAEIVLQKKAANLGANIVLIKKREAVGGYGEIPIYYIEGTAYSYE